MSALCPDNPCGPRFLPLRRLAGSGPQVSCATCQCSRVLTLIAAVQAASAIFVIAEVIMNVVERSFGLVSALEILLAVGHISGAGFLVTAVVRASNRLERQNRALDVASGALWDVIDRQFTLWSLTPAEREVGLLALKGLDNAEIAAMRGAATGTVRAQMTHIYQKAGVSGRAQFAAWFVEDLLQDGLDMGTLQTDRAA